MSMLQQVPLSLWEISQELGNMGTEQLSGKDDLGVYRKRVGSALKGAPVIDYTSEGTRASRMQRWDKLRNDRDGLAATRYQQALRYRAQRIFKWIYKKPPNTPPKFLG